MTIFQKLDDAAFRFTEACDRMAPWLDVAAIAALIVFLLVIR